MNSTLRGLAAEIMPDWLKPKAVDTQPDPRQDPADKPMPAPAWKPEVESPPIDPKKGDDETPDEEDDEVGQSSSGRGVRPLQSGA